MSYSGPEFKDGLESCDYLKGYHSKAQTCNLYESVPAKTEKTDLSKAIQMVDKAKEDVVKSVEKVKDKAIKIQSSADTNSPEVEQVLKMAALETKTAAVKLEKLSDVEDKIEKALSKDVEKLVAAPTVQDVEQLVAVPVVKPRKVVESVAKIPEVKESIDVIMM
jgi:hypothetical protein